MKLTRREFIKQNAAGIPLGSNVVTDASQIQLAGSKAPCRFYGADCCA